MGNTLKKFNLQYWLVALVVGVALPWLLHIVQVSRFDQIVWLLFLIDFVLAAAIGYVVKRLNQSGLLIWLLPIFCLLGLYLFFPRYTYYLAAVDLGISYLAYGLTTKR